MIINSDVLLERIQETTELSEKLDEQTCLVVTQIGNLAKAVLYLAQVVEHTGGSSSGFVGSAIADLQSAIWGLR